VNKILWKYFLLAGFCFLIGLNAHSQTQDTVKKIQKPNKKAIYGEARKATIMSMLFPGLGQIYNRKYWKAPIIYAGIGGFGYLFLTNQQKFDEYRIDLQNSTSTDPNVQMKNTSGYTSDQLYVLKTQYRKSRDLGIIGIAVIYLLNIIDANVDAHLKTFDVSDNLSMQVKPYGNYAQTTDGFCFQSGITLQLNFK
jgi:hypothetical protein